MLPIFEKHCPSDERPRGAITAAYEYLDGKRSFTVVKESIEAQGRYEKFSELTQAQMTAYFHSKNCEV